MSNGFAGLARYPFTHDPNRGGSPGRGPDWFNQPVRANPLKATLSEGGSIVGLLCVEFPTTGIARLAGAAGCDFVLYDMEHSGWSLETLRTLVATTRGSGVTPLVRVPEVQRNLVSRSLDLGAAGVMIPMAESAGDAQRLVEYARYPPEGTRGVGALYPDDVEGGLAETLARSNREQLLIAQIETAAGVEHVEEIAAVEGVDVLWIGHFDLTTSLGVPGQFGHPRHAEAVARVFAAAEAAGTPVATLATSVEEAQEALRQGYRAVAYGDSLVFSSALRQAVGALRS